MNRAFPVRSAARKRSSFRAIILAGSLAAAYGSAAAVGLGRPVTVSSLGQPLSLLVPLRLDADEQLPPECVSAEVQAGDARLPGPLVRVAFETSSDGTPRALRVTTIPHMEEPVVVVNLSVGCPTRLTRQFVAFIDPPAQAAPNAPPAPLTAPPSAVQAPAEAAPRRVAAASAPMAQEPLAAETSPPLKPAASRPARTASKAPPRIVRLGAEPATLPDALSAAAASEPARPAKPAGKLAQPAGKAASAPATQAARLQLDVPEVLRAQPAASAPEAAASTGTAEASADAARLRLLEESLAQLRAEAKATNEKLTLMRTQLQAAQQDRMPGWLVYGLGVLALILGGSTIQLWRLRERERHQREAAWWDSPEAAGHSLRPEAPEAAPTPATSPATRAPSPVATVVPPAPVPSTPAPAPIAPPAEEDPDATIPPEVMQSLRASRQPGPALHEQTLAFARVSGSPDYLRAHAIPRELSLLSTDQGESQPELKAEFSTSLRGVLPGMTREVSVEELIDLEQQAEFFVVLGQDDAAIDLLLGHVRSSGSSALPYLKLLEIYKRLGDQGAYADVRGSFVRHFGVQAPPWDADQSELVGLEGYPEVMEAIGRRWKDFGSSMDLLQRLLVKPADRASDLQSASGSVDLAAYLDLLLLYSVARDLSEHEVRGHEVDVFLPLEAPGASPGAARMMATLPVEVDGPRSRLADLDLDISVGDSAPGKLR